MLPRDGRDSHQDPNQSSFTASCLAGRKNEYDGETEYWVRVKETGRRMEKEKFETRHEKTEEVVVLSFKFYKII